MKCHTCGVVFTRRRSASPDDKLCNKRPAASVLTSHSQYISCRVLSPASSICAALFVWSSRFTFRYELGGLIVCGLADILYNVFLILPDL